MAEKVIIAYKGFNRDMTCKGYQYEEGKTYTTQTADVCNTGFHACEYPLDVFGYYPPGTSVYHEVQQSGEISRDNCDTKQASTKIKIGAELSIRGLVKAAINYTKARTITEHTDPAMATAGNYGAATAGDGGAATAGDYGAATAGYSGAATAGDGGAATAGNRGAATAGNRGAATAGYSGAATAGDGGAATAGNRGAATAGNYGAATAGNRGAATAGNYGAATSRGKTCVGENGIGLARGNNVKVKGGIGAILLLAEEEQKSYEIKAWKAEYVDGERIKADTWYKLKNDEFVEVGEDD